MTVQFRVLLCNAMQIDTISLAEDLEGRFERDQRPVLAFKLGARLLYVNSAFERLTGFERDKVVDVVEQSGDFPWYSGPEQKRSPT